MNEEGKDAPVDGVDYFDTFYSISDTEDPQFGLKQVKESLKGILAGSYITTFSSAQLWVLFSTGGPNQTSLLNRDSKYAAVFEKLIKMPRTEKEIAELTKWANDPDDDSIPLSGLKSTNDNDVAFDLEGFTEGGSGETGENYENDDPLDYDDEHGKYNLEKKKIFPCLTHPPHEHVPHERRTGAWRTVEVVAVRTCLKNCKFCCQ